MHRRQREVVANVAHLVAVLAEDFRHVAGGVLAGGAFEIGELDHRHGRIRAAGDRRMSNERLECFQPPRPQIVAHRTEMAEEKDRSFGIDFPFERQLSLFRRLHERDFEQTVARRRAIDHRREVLLHVLPRELFQPLLERSFFRIVEEPRNAEIEAALSRRHAQVLTDARLARAVGDDDDALQILR